MVVSDEYVDPEPLRRCIDAVAIGTAVHDENDSLMRSASTDYVGGEDHRSHPVPHWRRRSETEPGRRSESGPPGFVSNSSFKAAFCNFS